jgi:hypothetical protein
MRVHTLTNDQNYAAMKAIPYFISASLFSD